MALNIAEKSNTNLKTTVTDFFKKGFTIVTPKETTVMDLIRDAHSTWTVRPELGF